MSNVIICFIKYNMCNTHYVCTMYLRLTTFNYTYALLNKTKVVGRVPPNV